MSTPVTDAPPHGASLELLVTDVRLEAEGVISIGLADPVGGELPEWQPGAHLELVLPSGAHRQYSLCGRPAERDRYRTAVLREQDGRGGSRELHDTGLVGRRIRANGPRNHFRLDESSTYLFIAGGIGITPILAMARSLGDAVPWRLHYGGRTRASMAFVDELVELGGDQVVISPQDVDGLLNLTAILATADATTGIYCCGPPALLDAVQQIQQHVAPDSELHVERFAASTAGPVPVPAAGNRPVEVELRSTGVTLHIGPEQSLLDAIREVVPGMPFSCTEGYCGSCETTVLEGTPDHRDEILTPQEREHSRSMFPCVSRALTPRLVVDL